MCLYSLGDPSIEAKSMDATMQALAGLKDRDIGPSHLTWSYIHDNAFESL